MQNIIRISAKTLGQLALPDFCPRCFWLRMRCQNLLPFQIFPGVFSSIDSYSKKITNCCFNGTSRLPRWFDPFGESLEPIRVPHHSEFYTTDLPTSIRLTGVPDEILQRPDGSYFIIDYKTARFTNAQDALLPLYHVQLNAYAYIAQRCGMGPVSGLGVIYYEPQAELTAGELDRALMDDGFSMPFTAHLIELPLRPDTMIPPLLKQGKSICDCTSAPEGRDGCEDCLRLQALLALMRRPSLRRPRLELNNLMPLRSAGH